MTRILSLITILGILALAFLLQYNQFTFRKALPQPIKEAQKSGENASDISQATTSVSSAIESKPRKEENVPLIPLPPQVEIPPIVIPPSPPAPSPVAPSVPEPLPQEEKIAVPLPPPPPPLPPLNEQALLLAIVKIQCPTSDNLGEYIGSGFVVKGDIVVTAAHVVMDSGSENCKVIFPSKERRPVHYLRGVIQDLADLKKRHDEEGIDVAVLKLPSLDSYPEAAAIFSEYPSIPYPVCGNPQMIGDSLLHFGYPSNFVNQDYLSKLDGEVITYAYIDGIKEQLSQDGTYTFKSPIFKFTNDESRLHPYMVSRVPSFYGDSGGLAFNAAKQCVLGPHRGGTIGRGAGENYSVFMILGWEKARALLP